MTVESILPVAQDGAGSAVTANRPQPSLIEKVFAMEKGDGETSYSQNSEAQAIAVDKFALPYLISALERLDLSAAAGPIVVADLGCSSGPNTVSHLSFIIDKLSSRIRSGAASPSMVPEFQAIFSDLPSNDFNNLFQSLANDARLDSGIGPSFFVSGVPGSFYGRLFCRSAVHVFFSASALHWLSKIPDAVLDKESPAFNRGSMWIEHSPPAVGQAYQEQALSDLKNFLQARAAELAPGGLLFFFCIGRPSDGLHVEMSPDIFLYMDEVWTDLIQEGVLTDEQRDTFNFPIYRRTPKDMAEAIQSVELCFEVLTNSLIASGTDRARSIWPNVAPTEMARPLTMAVRAIVGCLIETHIGKEAADVVWQRYEEKVGLAVPMIFLNPNLVYVHYHVVALVRK